MSLLRALPCHWQRFSRESVHVVPASDQFELFVCPDWLDGVRVTGRADVASNSQNFPLQKLSYKLPASWECPDLASMDVQEADKWCANKDRSKPFCTQSVKRREGGFKAVMFDTVFVCSNQPGSTPRICHTRSDEQCAPYAGLGGNWGKWYGTLSSTHHRDVMIHAHVGNFSCTTNNCSRAVRGV